MYLVPMMWTSCGPVEGDTVAMFSGAVVVDVSKDAIGDVDASVVGSDDVAST